ncbi:MAG: hypothetical protein ABEJ74_08405 [Haloferacaceae archaeon]
MSDRRAELEALAADLAARSDVEDAWVARGFRDHRMLFLQLPGPAVPSAVRERLEHNDLAGVNEVYDIGGDSASSAGRVGAGDRHWFVDLQCDHVDGYRDR